MNISEIDKALTEYKQACGTPGDFHTIQFDHTRYSFGKVEAGWDVSYYRNHKAITGTAPTLAEAWLMLSRKLGIGTRTFINAN